MKRSKKRVRLTKEARARILEMIADWRGEDFSWKLLVKAISAEFKGDWERQSIAKYPHLQREFQKTQERIRKAQRDEKAGRRVSRTRDEQIEFFKRQIELLNRENADLKKQLAEAETRLAKWRHNALMHRITVRMLDQPMQENDRGRSDRA